MRNSRVRAIVVLVGLLVLGALAGWVRHWLAVDRCLDSGGRWNAQRHECEHSDPDAACDPMVRVEPKVSVMFRTEWGSGALVLVVCRGTPAESADLSPLMTWLAEEARAGRMRTCRAGEERESPEAMATATRHLPGLKDWCFLVVSDI
jgi:hypothetical protein